MPKKKKTLKQKLQADARRQIQDVSSVDHASISHEKEPVGGENTFSLPQSYTVKTHRTVPSHVQKAPTQILIHEYKYLGKDLWKTAFLTSSIIILEIIIRFIFERG